MGLVVVKNYDINNEDTPQYNQRVRDGRHRTVERTLIFEGGECVTDAFQYLADHEEELLTLNNPEVHHDIITSLLYIITVHHYIITVKYITGSSFV